MSPDISMRIKELAETSGASNADVARAAGVSRSAVTKWFSGKSQPKADVLPALAAYFNVSLGSFYDDETAMVANAMQQIAEKTFNVAAGQGRINEDFTVEKQEGQLARVMGDSMYPSLHDGDIVRFVEAVDIEPSDFALVRIDGEAMTVKHVEWTEDGLWVRAENKEVFADRFFTVKEIATIPVQIVGKAVEYRRSL